MPFITVAQENAKDINLHYHDHGEGEILVMIHGYPFSGMAWEKQEAFFLKKGYRVITYDRRGFGQSSRPSIGYDYDTFAKDLNTLLNRLDLNNVTLIGHSMGTGEITRYLSSYGRNRVKKAVFISPIPPFLLKTNDNKDGIDQKIFDDIKNAIKKDRYAFMAEFLDNFYNLDMTRGILLSEEKLSVDFHLGSSSSPFGFFECVDAWLTDFRGDLAKIDVPSLIIQGDSDRILPFETTGKLLAEKINAKLEIIPDGSHGIPWTHAEKISQIIFEFLQLEKDESLEVENPLLH